MNDTFNKSSFIDFPDDVSIDFDFDKLELGPWEDDERSILDMTSELDIDLILRKEPTEVMLNIDTREQKSISQEILEEQMI